MTTYTRKSFRNAVATLGYTVKFKSVNFEDLARDAYTVVEIYDGKTRVNCGIMTPSHYERYKPVFELLNNSKILK